MRLNRTNRGLPGVYYHIGFRQSFPGIIGDMTIWECTLPTDMRLELMIPALEAIVYSYRYKHDALK